MTSTAPAARRTPRPGFRCRPWRDGLVVWWQPHPDPAAASLLDAEAAEAALLERLRVRGYRAERLEEMPGQPLYLRTPLP